MSSIEFRMYSELFHFPRSFQNNCLFNYNILLLFQWLISKRVVQYQPCSTVTKPISRSSYSCFLNNTLFGIRFLTRTKKFLHQVSVRRWTIKSVNILALFVRNNIVIDRQSINCAKVNARKSRIWKFPLNFHAKELETTGKIRFRLLGL